MNEEGRSEDGRKSEGRRMNEEGGSEQYSRPIV